MTDQQDTGRRCPRCDCPDGHTQCDHCKICPHAETLGVTCAVLHTDAEGNAIPCPGYPHAPERASKPPELYEPNATICPLVQRMPHDAHEHEGLRCPGWAPPDDTGPEAPSGEELNPALPVRPDPRQPAYDAVYEYIRRLGPYLPPDPVHRNAVIWRAVHAALGATPVGRCVSSHCVEGDHIIALDEESP